MIRSDLRTLLGKHSLELKVVLPMALNSPSNAYTFSQQRKVIKGTQDSVLSWKRFRNET
jgi:hypothetical protein